MKAMKLKNVNVVVVGLGLTGQSCVRFLVSKGANVIAMDSRSALQVDLSIPYFLGGFDSEKLKGAELILLSPGIDPKHKAIQEAVIAGVEIIGDVELFARFNRVPVIAITGSNGKSTVTTLVYEIFKAAGKQVLMGGNIGTPALELLDQKAEYIVLELSSFQLETIRSLNPLIATVLNVSDDHLDRHGCLEVYQQTKLAVYHNATHCIANRDDPLTWVEGQEAAYSMGLSPTKIGFSWNRASGQVLHNGVAIIETVNSQLTGSHNALNIQIAVACAMLTGISVECAQAVIDNFIGLSHRFETVLVANDVKWINDSKATNVGATLAAINSVRSELTGRLILIAGGESKGADFSPLAQVFEQYVSLLIAFGVDGNKLIKLKQDSVFVSSMKQAVETAKHYSMPGDVVLLSPACASFDMFKNYQDRGQCFAQSVREVAA
jgi:UDP-N-acetylmuramoylalanine--D-glutamate ligase